METTQTTSETFEPLDGAAMDAEVERLSKEHTAWLNRVCKHYFPPDIVRLVDERRRLKYVANWIKEQGYEIREMQGQHLTQFCRKIDGKVEVLAEFKIEFKGQQPRPPK